MKKLFYNYQSICYWGVNLPKFQVYKDASGKTRFRLRANNNKIVAIGEAYEQHASCLNGIRSIQKNAGASIEDLTIEGGPTLPNPKYQIYKDTSGEFRFRLKAANGEIIAQGEGYESKEGCLNGIEVVKQSATATIEDPFSSSKSEPESQIEAKTEVIPESQPPEPKPEAMMPEEEKEDQTPTAPILSAKEEIPQDYGPVDTTIELYPVSNNIAKGDKVTLQGKLVRTDTKQGIHAAKIRIFERDRSILGDDYLAFGNTTEDGSFNIYWKARRLSWRKDTGDIYAWFKGNEKAKPSKSTIQTIAIK
jgi:uncharacterized protein